MEDTDNFIIFIDKLCPIWYIIEYWALCKKKSELIKQEIGNFLELDYEI